MRKNNKTSRTKTCIFFIFTFLFLATIKANSQTVFYDSISNKKYAIIEVHKTYERIIEKGHYSVHMLEYLGNYCYTTNNYQKSKFYFDLLFKKYKSSDISSKSKEQYKTLKSL